jgi:DNA-binding NarL/FixJ family response regulator
LIDAGICGYVLKDETDEILVPMIAAVYEGDPWFSAGIMQDNATASPVANLSGLTDREIDVLEAIAWGMTHTQIARHFDLVGQTVRNYTFRIYETLGLESRSQAVAWVLKYGLPPKPGVRLARQQEAYAGIYRE